eukprot:1729186-Rhodomonas_salina.1
MREDCGVGEETERRYGLCVSGWVCTPAGYQVEPARLRGGKCLVTGSRPVLVLRSSLWRGTRNPGNPTHPTARTTATTGNNYKDFLKQIY